MHIIYGNVYSILKVTSKRAPFVVVLDDQECVQSSPIPIRRRGKFLSLMVHLYLCRPDRCGHQIHESKGDRQCKIRQKENVCLFCSYVFSVRTGQADRGINSPLVILDGN